MTPAERSVLNTDRWFAAVPEDRQALLLARARLRNVAAGVRIGDVGDGPDGLHAVLAGEVRLIGATAGGDEALAMIMGPGAWFGGLSVADGGPRTHEAVAFGAGRVLHVPQSAFDQAAAVEPLLYKDLALLICGYHRAALAVMAQTFTQPILVRLARILAGAARTGGSGTLNMRQDDLAAMLGVSRQTINKALKELQTAGLITVAYRQVVVRDAARLRGLGRA